MGFARQIRHRDHLGGLVQRAMYNALISQGSYLANPWLGKSNAEVPATQKPVHRAIKCLEEALSCVVDGDIAKTTLVQLRLLKCRLDSEAHSEDLKSRQEFFQKNLVVLESQMSDFEEFWKNRDSFMFDLEGGGSGGVFGAESDILESRKSDFEEVWKNRHSIMFDLEGGGSGGVFGAESDMLDVLQSFALKTKGVEYMRHSAEIQRARREADTEGPVDSFQQSLHMSSVMRKRFEESYSFEFLQSSLGVLDEAFLFLSDSRIMDTKGVRVRDARNKVLEELLARHHLLYLLTRSRDVAEKLKHYACLAARELGPSPKVEQIWHDILDLSSMALVCHFLSDCPRNIDSLFDAFFTVTSPSRHFGEARRKGKYTHPNFALLGNGLRALFETTWYIPTIDKAIDLLRLARGSQARYDESDLIRDPEDTIDLARAIFLRRDYLKSIVEDGVQQDGGYARALQVYKDPEFNYRTRYYSIENYYDKHLEEDFDFILQTERQDPKTQRPSHELLVTVAEFVDNKWFRPEEEEHWNPIHLLNDAYSVIQQHLLKSKEISIHSMTSMVSAFLKATIYRAQFSDERASRKERQELINAFELAISDMPVHMFFVFSPSLRSQNSILDNRNVFLRDCMSFPLHATHFAIVWDEIRSAVEVLEYGRSIIWSRMRRLRTMEAQLDGINVTLKNDLAQTCEELEQISTLEAAPDPLRMLSGEVNPKTRTLDHPSQVFTQKRRLEEKYKSIVDNIRRVPGYERFNRMTLFTDLQLAARDGPIIIVTMDRREGLIVPTYKPRILVGHAIIVLKSQDPVIVALGGGENSSSRYEFEGRITEISDLLDEIRRDPKSSNEKLKTVLEGIGELVVKDIVATLLSLDVREQSRIWWCLTSIFSDFPVHAAMWRYEREDGRSKLMCLNDLYISSYTPSLGALIQSRIPSNSKVARPLSPMLVVKQTEARLASAKKEVSAIVSAAIKAGHIDGGTLKVYRGEKVNERIDILKDLPNYGWLHLACHGVLDAADSFSSHFETGCEEKGFEQISLMDILKSKVPNAEFAFLSACHSAELPGHISREESLHLAAAMQFCGYRSVVGTQWPMNDDDGPRVAKWFYEYMFAEPKEGEEVGYLRSARALNKVTQRMRRHPDYKDCPERWVNFVHIGA